LADFATIFGRIPEVTSQAPGRVNLIGEHTDYNGGLVLPLALPLRTRVWLARRDDDRVRAASANLADEPVREYRRGQEARTGGWIDYVQGITQVLEEDGHRVPGFDMFVDSDVPVGSGLASSAALEVAVARALRAACDLPLDDLAIARVAHRAETGLVGAPVGIMDQMAASLGDARQALLLDTRTLARELVPLPAGVDLAIIDSGITHQHASGEYRVRRSECERAAAALGVTLLSDLDVPDLARAATLDPPLDRRVRHVVTENARVRDAVAAMRSGDLGRLGALLIASHASLRDDYEVSLPEIDRLVEIAAAEPDVFGGRLTGGGFGGCVLLLCAASTAPAVAQRILSSYHSATGRDGRVLLSGAATAWHEN
jgi:galactokinase